MESFDFEPQTRPSYLSDTCKASQSAYGKFVPTRFKSSAHIRTASNMGQDLDKGGGLDIHKKSVKAAIVCSDESVLESEFGMTILQLCKLKAWLLDNGCKRVAVESTASYWYRVVQVLSDELLVIVVNPLLVKDRSGKKTDKIDARKLATKCLKNEVKPSREFTKEELELKRLTRAREQNVKIRSKLRNQIHSVLDAAGIGLSLFVSDIFGKSGMYLLRGLVDRKSLEELIPGIPTNRIRRRAQELPELIPVQLDDVQVLLIRRALSTMDNVQKSIDEIDAQLYKKADSRMDDLKILMSVPGVQFTAAITILAEIGNYRDFVDGDQLACWSGLTPFVYDSGGKHKQGTRITKHGSKHLRWILNQVANGASNTKNSRLRKVYSRLLHRKGKPKAITALARKILSIIHHLLIKREMWEEEGFRKRRSDLKLVRTSSSIQLTWLDLLFKSVVGIDKVKPGDAG